MHNYYQLLTIEDVQKDEAAIMEVLTAIMDGKLPNDLRLLNYFKEIPICYGAEVAYVEKGMVEMKIHQTQAVAIMNQKMAFIKSSHLRHNVIAKAQRIRIAKQQVFFTQLSYVKISSERREHVRVKVSQKHEVLFRTENHSLEGTLDDISLGGLSMLTTGQPGVEEGAPGTIMISIPGASLQVPGRLLRSVQSEDGPKCVLVLDSSPRAETQISRFIFQLQTEIIKELKEQL